MLRLSLLLLLTCASAQVMAQNGRHATAGSCQESALSRASSSEQSPVSVPNKASVTRSKYAKPAAVPSGGGDDDVLPRARGNKWHSFLPGMFR